MGAHTEYGGYVIDYRKVRNFNCPDLQGCKVRSGCSRKLASQAILSADALMKQTEAEIFQRGETDTGTAHPICDCTNEADRDG